MPSGGGTQSQFTHEGGTDARTSSDGSVVFFYREGEVRRIAAAGGPESTVTKGVGRGRWTAADDKVYVVRDRGDRSVVAAVGPDGSNEKVVYEVPFRLVATGTVSAIAVSPRTGDIFLQQEERNESDLMIVEGFR